jgi:hypothetical protein
LTRKLINPATIWKRYQWIEGVAHRGIVKVLGIYLFSGHIDLKDVYADHLMNQNHLVMT